ncbi:MAG: PD40 domain-containing protein [Planctomycetes bacterium]|nr:PD40 domain-containing protein [Planctomycetota bacterium]
MQHTHLPRSATALLAVVALASASAAQGQVDHVSVSSSGALANGASVGGAISADGRFVVFESLATNLVAGDTNARRDVFLRDRLFQTTECISRAPNGDFGTGDSSVPVMSNDGRYIAYVSTASNLDPADTENNSIDPAFADVFLYDRSTQSTTLISKAVSGAQLAGSFDSVSISGDGSLVVFRGLANLATGLNSSFQLWGYHTQSGALERIDDPALNLDFVRYPSVSGDGRFVAFRGAALLSNSVRQVYVRDRLTGATTLASILLNGAPANSECRAPSISDDGRFVAFETFATNDFPTPPGQPVYSRVYVRDLVAGATRLASANAAGVANTNHCNTAVISPDGRRVAFYSNEFAFVPADPSSAGDALVRDLATGALLSVATTSTGEYPDGSSFVNDFRADGAAVLFSSTAVNLTSGDTNNLLDVFVKELTPLIPISYCTAQSNTLGCTAQLSASGLPSATLPSAFTLQSQNLTNQRPATLFYGFAPNSLPFFGGTLCVASPLFRTPAQSTGGSASGTDCSGAFSFDFNALIRSGAAPLLTPGTVVYAQASYSQPSGGRVQSAALAFTILP